MEQEPLISYIYKCWRTERRVIIPAANYLRCNPEEIARGELHCEEHLFEKECDDCPLYKIPEKTPMEKIKEVMTWTQHKSTQ